MTIVEPLLMWNAVLPQDSGRGHVEDICLIIDYAAVSSKAIPGLYKTQPY